MKYIKEYNTFKKEKNQPINEEVFGIFKALKKKLSLGFSKMFGTAKKINKLIEEYKEELIQAKNPTIEAQAKFIEAKKEDKEKEDKEKEDKKNDDKKNDDIDLDKLEKKFKKVEKLYDQSKKKIKEKFDLKFNKAIEEEKNDNIKFYVKMRKLEMEQELIQDEIKKLTEKTGLGEDELKEIGNIKNEQKRMKEINSEIKKTSKQLENAKKSNDKKDEDEKIEVGDTVEYTTNDGNKNTGVVTEINGSEVKIKYNDDGDEAKKFLDDITLDKKAKK